MIYADKWKYESAMISSLFLWVSNTSGIVFATCWPCSPQVLTVGEEWQVVDTRTVADWQTDTVQEAEYVSVGITDEQDNTVTDEQSEHDCMPMTKSEEHKDRHSNTL